MEFLVFRLEGPLQSWGERSHWDHRDTALMPTKSGVIGLLGCCLGYSRGDERLAALSRTLRMAVRADRPGRIMEDFHTVRGTGGVLLAAGGKKRTGGDTILTPRQYLQGAAFQVFLEGGAETLRACACAMKSPHWPPYLGRKSCPPSVPLLPELVSFPSLEEAVRAYPVKTRDANASSVLQAEIECAAGEGEGEALPIRMRLDEIVAAQRDLYLGRRVCVTYMRTGEVGA